MCTIQPRYIPNKDAKDIVIFIHGIVEGPEQFAHLMEISVASGYAAVALLLPGHGGSGKEFAQSSKEEWQNHVYQQIKMYREKYDHIILAGHSMGGLLSFLAYLESPKQIIGIIVIDTPLYVYTKWRAIRNNLKVGFCKNIPEHDPASALLRASSVAPCSVFRYVTWAPRIIDLFQLMARTRKILPQITIPTLVFHADQDELVSAYSVRVFERKLPQSNRTIVRLPYSTHFAYGEKDLKILYETFLHFLRNLQPMNEPS